MLTNRARFLKGALDILIAMAIIKRVNSIPANVRFFYDEMALGINKIYGNRASNGYRKIIDTQIEQAILHPQVITLSAENDGKTVGICCGIIQDGKGSIVLLHVLTEFEQKGIEALLIKKMIEELAYFSLDGIIYENIPLFDAKLKDIFAQHDFSHLPRILMNGPLIQSSLKLENHKSIPIQDFQFEKAASILIDSYREHPDRILHQEIRSKPAAVKLINNVQAGMYGTCISDYIRWIFDGQEP